MSKPLSPDRPVVPEVLPLAQLVYQQPGHFSGGCLHITLDDGNVETDHIVFCINEARKAGCSLCACVGFLLLQMTTTQRAKVSSKVYEASWPLSADPYPEA